MKKDIDLFTLHIEHGDHSIHLSKDDLSLDEREWAET